MKKIIKIFAFLIASFSLSARAESFDTEYARFKEVINTSSEETKAESSAKPVTPEIERLQYQAYVNFVTFLFNESLKIYKLDYIIQNKAEALRNILYLNLRKIYCLDEELDFAVDNLYRDLMPGFCICLMNIIGKQRLAMHLTPKL